MVDVAVRAQHEHTAETGIRRPWWSRLPRGQALTILAGLTAGALNFAVLARADDGVALLVADGELAAGRALTGADLTSAEVHGDEGALRGLVPAHALSAGEHWVLRHGLRHGEPLRWSDLRRAGRSDGRRAMSLPVEPEHAVNGDIRPGDLIDIAVVRDGAAAWVLTGVELIATSDADDGLTVLTVAVLPHEALALAVALREGEVDVVRAGGGRLAGEPAP